MMLPEKKYFVLLLPKRIAVLMLTLLMVLGTVPAAPAASDGQWMKPFAAFPDLPQGEFRFDFTDEDGMAPTAIQMHFVGGSYQYTCPVNQGGDGITPDGISHVTDAEQTRDLILTDGEVCSVYLGHSDVDNGTDFGTFDGYSIRGFGSIDLYYTDGASIHEIDAVVKEKYPEFSFGHISPFTYTYRMESGSGHSIDCGMALYRDGEKLYAIASDLFYPAYLGDPGTGGYGPDGNVFYITDLQGDGYYNAFFEITAVFMGEYAGQEVVNVLANDESGETGFSIPPGAAAGIVLAAGGAGAAVLLKGRKKGKTKKTAKKPEKKQPDEPEQEEKEDEPEEESRYELRVKKDFGDTLYVGEKQTVYARMVEISPNGMVRPANDLTARILISSPDGVKVTNRKMQGEYIAAEVEIPEENTGNTGTVSFSLAGVYRLNMKFAVMREEIRFFQENLTLPAVYEETTLLPFFVEAGKDAEITAVIEPAGGYEAEVEPAEEEGLWYAKIRELSKKVHEPGTVESFTLHVIMQRGKLKLMGDLPLYRFHMGFKVKMGPAIGCHFELKDEVWMSGGVKLGDARDYQPARTNITMAVYDWDADAHEVLVAAVAPGEEDVRFTALAPENQEKLNKLGVKLLYGAGSESENGRTGTFICTEAVLDPPTKFKAKLSIHTAFNGRDYTYERDVIMASQKWRDTKEIADNTERDQRITAYLENLRDSIENSEDLEHLFPLAKYIGIMLDGYSETYGYDERQVARVQDIYARYLRGELLGANAEAQTITFADELEMYISAFIDTGASVEQSLGFWGNLAVGVISLGHSDAIFAAFKAAKSMKDYVARGGDSAWGAFFVGAASATGDYLMSKATDAALGAAVKGGKYVGKKSVELAGKLAPKTVGAASDAVEQAVKKTKEYLSEKVGKRIKNVLEKSGNEKARAKTRVEADIKKSNSKPMSAEDMHLEALESRANKAAKVKLDDLEAARQVAEKWPTTENMEYFRKKVLEVQQDKSAMYQLKTKAGADDLRASFNREMKSIYGETDRIVQQQFESQGMPLKKNPQSATNSSAEALKKGQTVTMDRDVTYYAEDGGLLKQGEAQTAYEKAFYKVTKGVDAPSDEAAHAWAKLNDQSVVQKASGEHYGNQHDLEAMLKNHDEALFDPNRVGKVVSDKGLEWMKEGESMIREGKAMTDTQLGERLMEEGLKCRKEGMRQITKQYKYVDARDISRACRSGDLHISEELRYGVEMFNNTLTDGPSHISVAKCESLLKEKGLTLEDVAVTLGEIVKRIG